MGLACEQLGIDRLQRALNLRQSFLSGSATEFMIQPGGGVDVRVTDAFALRLQGDYQWVAVEDWIPRSSRGMT